MAPVTRSKSSKAAAPPPAPSKAKSKPKGNAGKAAAQQTKPPALVALSPRVLKKRAKKARQAKKLESGRAQAKKPSPPKPTVESDDGEDMVALASDIGLEMNAAEDLGLADEVQAMHLRDKIFSDFLVARIKDGSGPDFDFDSPEGREFRAAMRPFRGRIRGRAAQRFGVSDAVIARYTAWLADKANKRKPNPAKDFLLKAMGKTGPGPVREASDAANKRVGKIMEQMHPEPEGDEGFGVSENVLAQHRAHIANPANASKVQAAKEHLKRRREEDGYDSTKEREVRESPRVKRRVADLLNQTYGKKADKPESSRKKGKKAMVEESSPLNPPANTPSADRDGQVDLARRISQGKVRNEANGTAQQTFSTGIPDFFDGFGFSGIPDTLDGFLDNLDADLDTSDVHHHLPGSHSKFFGTNTFGDMTRMGEDMARMGEDMARMGEDVAAGLQGGVPGSSRLPQMPQFGHTETFTNPNGTVHYEHSGYGHSGQTFVNGVLQAPPPSAVEPQASNASSATLRGTEIPKASPPLRRSSRRASSATLQGEVIQTDDEDPDSPVSVNNAQVFKRPTVATVRRERAQLANDLNKWVRSLTDMKKTVAQFGRNLVSENRKGTLGPEVEFLRWGDDFLLLGQDLGVLIRDAEEKVRVLRAVNRVQYPLRRATLGRGRGR